MGTIGFIGGGNMAEALIKGIIAAGIYLPKSIFVSDVRHKRLKYLEKKYRVKTTGDNAELAAVAGILVLAVKPQNMTEAVQTIKDSLKKNTLVISIAAGRRISSITDILGNIAVVRVMPNTPALIGEGASALFANEKAKPMLKKAEKIFSSVGLAVIVDNEDLIDAATAVNGSGPAYYFLLMEEMIKAAIRLGLSENAAKDLVLQTAKGAALLAVEADKNGENPAELRRKVTSPGGTTEAAINVFRQKNFSRLVADAVKAACKKSRHLSKH